MIPEPGSVEISGRRRSNERPISGCQALTIVFAYRLRRAHVTLSSPRVAKPGVVPSSTGAPKLEDSLLPVELVFGKGIAQPFTVIDSLSFPKRGQKKKFLGGVSWHTMVGICLLRSEMSAVPSICPLKGDKEPPTPP